MAIASGRWARPILVNEFTSARDTDPSMMSQKRMTSDRLRKVRPSVAKASG